MLQAHSESSLLDDKQPLRAERSLAASENRRPESAPSYSPRRTKNCTTHSTGLVGVTQVCVGSILLLLLLLLVLQETLC